MNRIALTLLSVVVALPAAAQARPPQATDGIVAIVGTHPILWTEVLEVIGQERSRGAQLPQDSAGAADFAKNILNNLIDEQILLQRATGDTAITVADADLAQTVERQVGQIRSQFPSDQEFLRQLRSAGFGTQEEYRRWMTEQARQSEMQRRLVQRYQSEGKLVRVAVSDVDVNEAYEREKAKFPKRPPAVTFRQLVIAPQASQPALARARSRSRESGVAPRRNSSWRRLRTGRTSRVTGFGVEGTRWRPWLESARRVGPGIRADDVRVGAGPGQSARPYAVWLPHHQGRTRQTCRGEGAAYSHQAGVYP